MVACSGAKNINVESDQGFASADAHTEAHQVHDAYKGADAHQGADSSETKPQIKVIGAAHMTVLANNVPAYASFAGYQNRVVQNANGIFVAYLEFHSPSWPANQYFWRLVRSQDGGKSFKTVHSGYAITRAPVVETDGASNVYVLYPNLKAGSFSFLRFDSATNYSNTINKTIKADAGGKFVSHYDAARKRIYFMTVGAGAWTRTSFFALDLTGSVLFSYRFSHQGSMASLHYPHLAMNDSSTTLYAAWTTDKDGQRNYSSIHFARSTNGGMSWSTMTGNPLSPSPTSTGADNSLVPDIYGPTDNLLGIARTNWPRWLANFFYLGGALHFAVSDKDGKGASYMRYDLKKQLIDRQTYNAPRTYAGCPYWVAPWDMYRNACYNPSDYYKPQFQYSWKGKHVKLASGGYFAKSRIEPNTIYHVGEVHHVSAPASGAINGRLGILRSQDNGAAWSDYAISAVGSKEKINIFRPWSFSGPRAVTTQVFGVFTHFSNPSGSSNQLVFFSFPAGT